MDRIAYVNHDIDDAVRAGVLDPADLPAEPIAVLGDSGSARIDTLVHDVVEHSRQTMPTHPAIRQGDDAGAAMAALRTFMFDHVYLAPQARAEHAKIERVLRTLFDHFCARPDDVPRVGAGTDGESAIVDYLAGMTDRFCIRSFERLAVPRAFEPGG